MARNTLKDRKRILIIAEAGVNHNGSVEMALEMVDAAALAGADVVKFQTFRAEEVAIAKAPMAEYQKITTRERSQLDMIRKLELDRCAHERIIERCRQKGIMFMSTPFDRGSVKLLADLGLEVFKIPSGEITNYPYLVDIARLGRPVIMSTGMADMDEIRAALDVLVAAGMMKKDIILLLATSAYPTPFEDVNLRAMASLSGAFGVSIGFSDHTPGIEASLAAAALGAVVIEKHFTLDKTLPGPDHQASLEVGELTALVRGIRNIEHALGTPLKGCTPSESVNVRVARKSIVAARPIRKGELFTDENLTTKRPAGGLSPMAWPKVIGRVAEKDFAADDAIIIGGLIMEMAR